MAETETAIPPVGSEAPDFTLPATDGSEVHLADLRGKTVLLYFYPKDDTPGCTTEACAFRDAWGDLQARGVVVLGVSRDDVKSHQKFTSKYHLPFPLLADLGGEVAQRYGVWVEKSMYGKTYMSMARTSFLILPDGTIGHVWEKVKPEGHAADVLAWVNSQPK
ncbi:MAG TPA: thioredoxin-dependent thiol peroxidase [Ktedonobacterales bacterium]|jgi:peroxiredoxin Q/BCP|nr:thioredoxin-dependent thiol peroxidase [Ktedonobacterales bacterium]